MFSIPIGGVYDARSQVACFLSRVSWGGGGGVLICLLAITYLAFYFSGLVVPFRSS